MTTLQVRNLPDDLHEALSARSKELGVSMSEFVTRTLRAELSRPTVASWVETVRQARSGPSRPIDVVGAVDLVRIEYDPADA